MGSLQPNAAVVVAVAAVALAALVAGGSCWTTDDGHKVPPPGPNITADYNGKWLAAKATWYGSPIGAGPLHDAGACGFGDLNLPPYSGMVSCGNSPIFRDGKGCGSCYEIKCTAPRDECSDQPVVVFITDANDYPLAPYHFDLSGTAFGAMAKPGLADRLRHRGIIDMEFRRVRCKYPPGKNIVFRVEHGSNPSYLSLLFKFVAGDGDIVQMDLKQEASPEWEPMKHSSGAVWRIKPHRPLKGPLSIRLTSESGKKLVATDVIPENWKTDTFYQSNIQF